MKQPHYETLTLDAVVGGGQTIGTLENGKKALVWGGLPGENVTIQVTKKKSSYVEGVVTEVHTASSDRIAARDSDSFLSTSPWQLMPLATEQHYKATLIEEAFELHDIVLPKPIDVYTDNKEYEYRNKIEFSWWWDTDKHQLDLAFFRRGTHGKIPVEETSLAAPAINESACRLRDILRKRGIEAYDLKTVMVRASQKNTVAMQLYVKNESFPALTQSELQELNVTGFELIYSNPKSPASVITKRLQAWGNVTLQDSLLDVPFTYATEGFFQINLPVYEQALRDMALWIPDTTPVVDLYSGVGTIGLTIGTKGKHVTLVESNEHAVREMRQNIATLKKSSTASAVLAPSEEALEYIDHESTIIVDPPRAGLHDAVIARLLETAPDRIIYLSCNPVTQARDVAKLSEKYGIRAHQGYNFFPHTPHIEHLVILDRKTTP